MRNAIFINSGTPGRVHNGVTRDTIGTSRHPTKPSVHHRCCAAAERLRINCAPNQTHPKSSDAFANTSSNHVGEFTYSCMTTISEQPSLIILKQRRPQDFPQGGSEGKFRIYIFCAVAEPGQGSADHPDPPAGGEIVS